MTIRLLSNRLLMLLYCLPLLIAGCGYSKAMSPESSLLSQPVFNVPGSNLDVPNGTPHASHAIEEDTAPPVVLIGGPGKKSEDCGVVEVDKDTGKPIAPPSDEEKRMGGVKHWPCQKIPNGSGGYMCNATTNGKSGCNFCPSCTCHNEGSGSSQNCVCS